MSAATRCLRKIEDISEADGEENKSVWWAAAEDDGAFSAAISASWCSSTALALLQSNSQLYNFIIHIISTYLLLHTIRIDWDLGFSLGRALNSQPNNLRCQ